MAIFFALVTMFGWATGDTIIAHTSRKIGNRTALFWWLFFGVLCSSFYIPFAGPVRDWGMMGISFLFGIIGTIGTLAYFQAFEKGNASIAGAVGGSYSLITVALSVFFFGESVTMIGIIAIICILIGLILTSLNLKELRKMKGTGFLSDPAVLPATISMVLWGIYFALVRLPVEANGWYWGGYAGNYFFLLMPLLGILPKGFTHVLRKKNTLVPIVVMSVLTTGANFSFNAGVSHGYTSVVAPIAGSFPVLLVVFTRIFFREYLSFTQKTGIGIALAGLVLMSFFGQ